MRSANLLESKDVATRRQVSNQADPLATETIICNGQNIGIVTDGEPVNSRDNTAHFYERAAFSTVGHVGSLNRHIRAGSILQPFPVE